MIYHTRNASYTNTLVVIEEANNRETLSIKIEAYRYDKT